MEFKDYYQILGVKKSATSDEIKKAYRLMARKYHPDVSKEPDAEEKMKAVNEANAVLSDPEQRAAYDQLGKGQQANQDFRPPPNWDTGFEYSGTGANSAQDFSDFFSDLFRHTQQNQNNEGRAQHNSPRQGQDRHAKIVIDLKDSYLGTSKNIELQTPTVDAQGRVSLKHHTINVKIPKGVKQDQMIRLIGQGDVGSHGASAGDLYLQIHFSDNTQYRVDGKDVYETIPITPWEAALGARIKIPTPSGLLEVKIPPNASNGQKLRLKGQGIPSKVAGDLYIELSITLPKADSAQAKALYEEMAEKLAFNPRQSLGV